MHRLLSLLARFRSDERGAFLAIFAIMGIALIAMSGAVVDYTSVEQVRTRAQVALDAAALALQPDIYTKTPEELRSLAESLLLERLGNGVPWTKCVGAGKAPCAQVSSAAVNTKDGIITLNANVDVPLYFVALVGIDHMKANVLSEVSHKKLNLEVALVLDNSNSMDTNSRMVNLIAATKCAANMLFNGDCASTATVSTNDNVSMAIIPFTMLVNVGKANATATWMDNKGLGATNITTDNFDNDDNDATDFAGGVDRIALVNSMKGVTWGGCVEARKPPYDTDDTPPVSTNSDTMFTPMFAPDEPDSGFSNSYIPDSPASCNQTGTCTWTETKTKCTNYTDCKTGTNPSVLTNGYTLAGPNVGTNTCTCSSGGPFISDSGTATFTGSGTYGRTYTRVRTCSLVYSPNGLSNRELQERICKYNGATPTGVSQAGAHGPNSDCPVNAITPLTPTKATIMTAISQLDPQGGTNIHAGTEWGFRVLSPGEPFTQARAYNPVDTAKYMIIMTDGENTAYQTSNMNNTTYYSNYGFPFNNRLGTATSTNAQLVTEMNTRTTTTCDNAKKAGITIYTVGLSVNMTTNVAANTAMLQKCATTPQNAYFPTASTELTAVFKKIIDDIDQLHIAR